MVKIFLALCFAWGFTNVAGADPVGLGVRAGASMANLVYPYPLFGVHSDVLFGFTGGLFVDAGLNDFLSLQPEADFTTKGTQLSVIPTPAVNQYGQVVGELSGTFSDSYNYLEFPLLLKAHTSLGPQVTGSLLAGPSLGIFLSGNNHYSISGTSGNVPLNAAGLDWGALFGAEIEINRFLLDLRYDLGLTSISPNGAIGAKGPTTSVLSLEAGYRIL